MPDLGDCSGRTGEYGPERTDDTYWWDDPDELRDVEVIRLMADEDVDCPLWSGGLLFSDASEFIRFGAPPGLAHDLAEWAADRQANGRTPRVDAWALALVERLTIAFAHRYRFVYKP